MDALARLNPVKPPKVNRNKNPIAKRLHVVVLIAPVHKVNYGYRELKINLSYTLNAQRRVILEPNLVIITFFYKSKRSLCY